MRVFRVWCHRSNDLYHWNHVDCVTAWAELPVCHVDCFTLWHQNRLYGRIGGIYRRPDPDYMYGIGSSFFTTCLPGTVYCTENYRSDLSQLLGYQANHCGLPDFLSGKVITTRPD